MKKFIKELVLLTFVIVICFGFAACNNNEYDENKNYLVETGKDYPADSPQFKQEYRKFVESLKLIDKDSVIKFNTNGEFITYDFYYKNGILLANNKWDETQTYYFKEDDQYKMIVKENGLWVKKVSDLDMLQRFESFDINDIEWESLNYYKNGSFYGKLNGKDLRMGLWPSQFDSEYKRFDFEIDRTVITVEINRGKSIELPEVDFDYTEDNSIKVGVEYSSDTKQFQQELNRFKSIANESSCFKWNIEGKNTQYSYKDGVISVDDEKGNVKYFLHENNNCVYIYKEKDSWAKNFLGFEENPFSNFDYDDTSWESLQLQDTGFMVLKGHSFYNGDISCSYDPEQMAEQFTLSVEGSLIDFYVNPNITIELPTEILRDYTKIDYEGFRNNLENFVKLLEQKNYTAYVDDLFSYEGNFTKYSIIKRDNNKIEYLQDYGTKSEKTRFYDKEGNQYVEYRKRWVEQQWYKFTGISLNTQPFTIIQSKIELLGDCNPYGFRYDFDDGYMNGFASDGSQIKLKFTEDGLRFSCDHPLKKEDEYDITLYDVGKTNVILPDYYFDDATGEWVDKRE